jgi:hypothetical protein
MDRDEVCDVLVDCRERIAEALSEARMALQDGAADEWDWAEAYWYSTIRTALDEDHDYVGGAGQTMQVTIDALQKGGE